MKILINTNPQPMLKVQTIVITYGLTGMFFITILAGTVVPLGSPALVVFASALGLPILPLIIIATLGFTIGITINYYLAYFLGRSYIIKKGLQDKLDDIMKVWDRWGVRLYILFGLVPVLPVELLSLVCGLLKMRLRYFLPITFGTRFVQFALLACLGEFVGNWIFF
ncbi:MAG: DedA family protein [Thermoplasmata archaeon]|nr:DedA family protein [Thermoplasmata archaeon]